MKKAIAAALLAACCAASAQTFGLHLVSAHFPREANMNDFNPGLYVITRDGWTGGFYRNTWSRLTVYGGLTFNVIGPVDTTLGLASGYKRELVDTEPFCQDGVVYRKQWQGHDRHEIGVLAALSLRGPAGFRLTWAPRVVHLSVERSF